MKHSLINSSHSGTCFTQWRSAKDEKLDLYLKPWFRAGPMFVLFFNAVCMSLCAYLIGLCILRTLSIFCLFDVLNHLSKKGVTVVLIFGHQYF